MFLQKTSHESEEQNEFAAYLLAFSNLKLNSKKKKKVAKHIYGSWFTYTALLGGRGTPGKAEGFWTTTTAAAQPGHEHALSTRPQLADWIAKDQHHADESSLLLLSACVPFRRA